VRRTRIPIPRQSKRREADRLLVPLSLAFHGVFEQHPLLLWKTGRAGSLDTVWGVYSAQLRNMVYTSSQQVTTSGTCEKHYDLVEFIENDLFQSHTALFQDRAPFRPVKCWQRIDYKEASMRVGIKGEGTSSSCEMLADHLPHDSFRSQPGSYLRPHVTGSVMLVASLL
jgi:hypothetical protein